MSRLFVFGLGYSALTLARRLTERGWTVAGTVRTPEKAGRLRAGGIEATVFDGARAGPDVGRALDGADHVLVSIAPDDGGDPVIGHHAAELCARAGAIRWLGYLSTVGVYGDAGGDWVDETTPPKPANTRGRRRVIAENAWQSFGARTGIPVAVFRIAGIYGPGRNQLVSIREGRAKRIIKPGQVFNRIHVEDIAGIVEASMAAPRAGAVYNVADDRPAPPQEPVAYAAKLLGVPPPPEVAFEEAEMTEMARSFYSDNKRVSNALVKSELGVRLAYPDFESGLKALYEAGEGR